MGIFNYWPYSNIHELNLDMIVKLVKEWVEKSDLYFKTTDEKIKYIEKNFANLKEYVDSYFASLDVEEAISDVLNSWLEDGTIETLLNQPILQFKDFYKPEFDGNLILRQRKNRYYSSSVRWSLQNGALYSPNGNYDLSNDLMRLYAWFVTSDNNVAEFKTFNMNNQELSSIEITNMQHGGPIVFKNNKAYSMNYGHNLTIFNLQNPDEPMIENQQILNLESNYLIGVLGDDFIGIKQDTVNKKLSIYRINDDFTSELFMFELEGGITGLFQDACLDPENQIIYWLSYEPNVIHMHSLTDGSQLSQMRIPDSIGYVSVGEAEFLDIKNDILLLGSFQSVGQIQDNKLDIKVWATTPTTMGNNSRMVALNLAGTREIYVDFQSADGRNPNVSALNGSVIFKYIEDAQLCAKALNRGAMIYVREDYNDGWQLFVDTVINFTNGAKTSAFNIDQNVNAVINDIRTSGFIGEPMVQDGITCWINQRQGSRVTYNNICSVNPLDADVLIYGGKCEIILLSATTAVNHIALKAGVLKTVAGLGGYIYLYNTDITAPFIDCSQADTQFISNACNLNCIAKKGNTTRPYLPDILGMKIPKQFVVNHRTTPAMGYRTFEELWGFKEAVGSATIYSACFNAAGESVPFSYSINRENVTIPLPGFNGTYSKWWISDLSVEGTILNNVLCEIELK